MSAGHKETQRDTTCPSGTPVFFSNPLMRDVESDWSPIHDAAFNGRVLALQRLIAQGTCVNLSTLNQVSPLHGACMQGNVACAKLLVENGANVTRSASRLLCSTVQYIDQSGSPLHVACSNQHLSTVRKLLQLGAGVNSGVRGGGDSSLHVAARLSSPELVSVLLDHGADHFLRNSEGKRPLDLAPPNSPVERLLRQAGGPPPLMQLCRLHIRKIVGKQRLDRIHDLHLPTEVKQYLLYQSDRGEDQ